MTLSHCLKVAFSAWLFVLATYIFAPFCLFLPDFYMNLAFRALELRQELTACLRWIEHNYK